MKKILFYFFVLLATLSCKENEGNVDFCNIKLGTPIDSIDYYLSQDTASIYQKIEASEALITESLIANKDLEVVYYSDKDTLLRVYQTQLALKNDTIINGELLFFADKSNIGHVNKIVFTTTIVNSGEYETYEYEEFHNSLNSLLREKCASINGNIANTFYTCQYARAYENKCEYFITKKNEKVSSNFFYYKLRNFQQNKYELSKALKFERVEFILESIKSPH